VNISSIARRYARAVFELAVEEGRFEEVGRELAVVRVALQTDADLMAALTNPSTTREEKLRVIDALAPALKLSGTVVNALRLLAERNKLVSLPQVEAVYRDMADQKAGRLRAKVISAVPLSEEAAASIAAGLSKATSRNVVIDRAVDPRVLGGVVAQVGSMVYDGSVKSQLEDLKKQLKA
jgi:F-type H+-transporting ATPase subunit delta